MCCYCGRRVATKVTRDERLQVFLLHVGLPAPRAVLAFRLKVEPRRSMAGAAYFFSEDRQRTRDVISSFSATSQTLMPVSYSGAAA